MSAITSSANPLLGRWQQLKKFEELMVNHDLKHGFNNAIVIFGNARIGKSRLLAKLMEIAEKYSGIHRTSFEEKGNNTDKVIFTSPFFPFNRFS